MVVPVIFTISPGLEPRKIRGVVSEAMLFDIGFADAVRRVLAVPEDAVPDGTDLDARFGCFGWARRYPLGSSSIVTRRFRNLRGAGTRTSSSPPGRVAELHCHLQALLSRAVSFEVFGRILRAARKPPVSR